MDHITRWEPLREMQRMRNMLDRMMDRAFLDTPFLGGFTEEWGVPIDVYQTDDDVIVKATMPGVKPEDIHISITGDTLNIRAEASEEREEEGLRYHLRERRTGSFSRSVLLPASVNADQAKAEFENGVLTLTLPKTEGVKPKTITVKAKG
jgi:HSP20 family protein